MSGNSLPIYRRRRWLGPLLRILCLLLGFLLLLSILFMAGFRKYITYTETGKLYLDIPWLYGYLDGPPEEDPLADCLTVTGGQHNLPFYQQQSSGSSSQEQHSDENQTLEADEKTIVTDENSSSPAATSEDSKTES